MKVTSSRTTIVVVNRVIKTPSKEIGITNVDLVGHHFGVFALNPMEGERLVQALNFVIPTDFPPTGLTQW